MAKSPAVKPEVEQMCFIPLRFPLGALKKDHRGIGVLRC